MNVIGVDARRSDAPPGVAELLPADALPEALPRGDFVIATVPETPETRGMFQAAQFGLMKQSAFFINIGRGANVILDDLVEALERGAIAGAALDVFQIEPLPERSPPVEGSWSVDNATRSRGGPLPGRPEDGVACRKLRSFQRGQAPEERGRQGAMVLGDEAPPAGLEPTHPAPEAGALSTELRGLVAPNIAERLAPNNTSARLPGNPRRPPAFRCATKGVRAPRCGNHAP